MGVFAGRGAGIDVLAISQEMRQAVRQWETCRIAILDPGASNVNFRTKSADAFVWTGWARVQPYRREIAVAVPANPTVTQTTRFQIDFSQDGAIPFMRNGFQVVVLTEAQGNAVQPDPHLSGYVHVINAGLNSSLAWVRTLETITNVEKRNDFQIALDDEGVLSWV